MTLSNSGDNNKPGNSATSVSVNASAGAGEKLLAVVKQHQLVLQRQELSLAEQLFAYGSMLSILVNPKNQAIIASLGVEMSDELRRHTFTTLVEYQRQTGLSLPQLFAQVCGLDSTSLADQTEAQAAFFYSSNDEAKTGLGGMEMEEGGAAVGVSNNPKRWTQARLLELVNSPLDSGEISRIRGRTYKEQVYLHNVSKTEQVVQLLGKYGQLTMYQMVGLLLNQETGDSQAVPWSLFVRVREATQALKLKELISASPVTGWEGLTNFNLWHLTHPGKLYYGLLNRVDNASLPQAQSGLLEHSYGINQVLASLSAACAMTTRLGVLDRLVQSIPHQDAEVAGFKLENNKGRPVNNTSSNSEELVYPIVSLEPVLVASRTPQSVPAPPTSKKERQKARQSGNDTSSLYSCRLELSHSEPVIELGQDGRKNIRPDAMGSLIYDTELVLPSVSSAANLYQPVLTGIASKKQAMAQLQREQSVSEIGRASLTTATINTPVTTTIKLSSTSTAINLPAALTEEAEFTGSASTGRQYWPFLLEYDRGTESSSFFAEKVEAYSSLYNTFQLAWPLQWGGKFPVILVVTEGGPRYLASLMTAVRRALVELRERKTAAKRLGSWWFTCTNWFAQVYGQYLTPQELAKWERHIYPSIAASNARFNSFATTATGSRGIQHQSREHSREKQGQPLPKTKSTGVISQTTLLEVASQEEHQLAAKLSLGPTPHIWLHLDTPVNQEELASVTKYLYLSAQKRASSQPPKLFSHMRSFPIPHVFNDLM